MLVNLSRSSWHSKYYNFVKGYYPTYEFKSLCPYFWTIVTLILLLPVILIWKGFKTFVVTPTKKIVKVVKKEPKYKPYKPYKEPTKFIKWCQRNDSKITKGFQYLYFGLMGGLLVLMISVGVYNLFSTEGFLMGVVYIFAGIGALTTTVLTVWGIISFFETDTWTMIKGMSYSIKNKVCPMITWE
jgi:hypothetical protein